MKASAKLAALVATMWLAFVASAVGYEIKLFPASVIYDADTEILHERLGLKGQLMKVEDFEDAEMESWLHANLQGGGGEGTDRTAWAGNLASAYVEWARMEIDLPNIRVLGIGLGDNDGGDERVSINGDPAVPLKTFPGHVTDGRTRAYYVIIEAEPGEASIRSVAFDQCFTVHFDHLIVLQGKTPQKEGKLFPRLVLDLTDGTRLVGSVSDNLVLATPRDQPLDLPLDRILSMQIQKSTDAVTIFLKNGEKIAGRARFDALKLTTILGEFSVPREKIRHLRVSFRGEYRPAEQADVKRPEARFYGDEPSFEGRSLRFWLDQSGPKPRAGKAWELLAPDADAKSAEWLAAEEVIRKIGAQAIPFLIEMLRHGDQDARKVVRAFAALGDAGKTAFPDLVLLLDESDETIHVCTIWAIGYIGPAANKAIPVLLDELRLGSIGSLPAAEALGNIGPASVDAVSLLIAKLQSEDPRLWDLPLIISLGKIGSKDAVPLLVEIAQGTDPRSNLNSGLGGDLRKHRAVEALGNIGPLPTTAVPVLVELLQKQGFGNLTGLYFAEKICRTLGSIGPNAKEAVPALLEIAARRDLKGSRQLAVKESAALALAKIKLEALK